MVRELLAGSPVLTPTSDGVAVAKGILAAHDAAELALATVADHIGVPWQRGAMYLMDYAAAVQQHTKTPLSGYDFLSQLNDARVSFKHKGILPNVPQWHRVGETTVRYVDDWCRDLLDVNLADLDRAVLIENATARGLYHDAKAACEASAYQQALEFIGQALWEALRGLPGILVPAVGKEDVGLALRLTAFGVNAGDFLTLQQLVPSVWPGERDGEWLVTWKSRNTGHEANWTEHNVRFCLATFVDVAIKIQHAPWLPWPAPFYWVYTDTATAKHNGATVWRYPWSASPDVVKKFEQGEVYVGNLQPTEDPRPDRFSLFLDEVPFERATAFTIFLGNVKGILFLDDFEVSKKPKEDWWVRRDFPHIFET